MITGIDTDVLVNWLMTGAPRHRPARRFIEQEVTERSHQLGLTGRVLYEFVHVVTDPRRFERPMSMPAAVTLARTLWDGREVKQIAAAPAATARALELLNQLKLGRKRILDTALDATLEAAGVRRFATFNRRDFAAFGFLDVVTPR